MATDIPQDSPPSYEVATDDGNDHTSEHLPKGALNHDVKHPITEASPLYGQPIHAGPSHTMQPGYTVMLPPVHHYANPVTGEHLSSLLSPNEPEMICLQEGRHIPHTEYGLLGTSLLQLGME
ncbi:hypothetical protein C0991_005051 [Blastosporella zonata]|nr:hypothetical protein C0991_005051 [Blastosporella zonata]